MKFKDLQKAAGLIIESLDSPTPKYDTMSDKDIMDWALDDGIDKSDFEYDEVGNLSNREEIINLLLGLNEPSDEEIYGDDENNPFDWGDELDPAGGYGPLSNI